MSGCEELPYSRGRGFSGGGLRNHRARDPLTDLVQSLNLDPILQASDSPFS